MMVTCCTCMARAVRHLPYAARRALLASLELEGPAWRAPRHFIGQAQQMLAATAEHGRLGGDERELRLAHRRELSRKRAAPASLPRRTPDSPHKGGLPELMWAWCEPDCASEQGCARLMKFSECARLLVTRRRLTGGLLGCPRFSGGGAVPDPVAYTAMRG